MADRDDVREFPDVNHKLAAPKKLSAYEKERQAAEAKRQRAEAENAAALREFEDSFADDSDDGFSRFATGGRAPPAGPRPAAGYGGPGGRMGLPPLGPRSGPGSLGPAPGAPAPPPSVKRKRALDEMREAQEATRERSMFGFEDEREAPRRASQFTEQDEDREDVVPKPTVHLSSLPPNTTIEEIKALLSASMQVHAVRFLPPAGPATVGKKSLAALATLSSDMTITQIDNAVSSLRERYMGCGFYLSISRHLSTSTLHPSMGGYATSPATQPFGAKPKAEVHSKFSMRHAPPPDQRGFAPPEFYERRAPASRPAANQVTVKLPPDMGTVRAIHVIADKLLAENDPQRALAMEALLMGLPEVQKDERFAFLYDSKSTAGVYYRWCLWGPDGPGDQKRRACGPERIFSDVDTEWLPPYKDVPFPDLTSLSQAVTDVDYVSSDEESDDGRAQIKNSDGPEGDRASLLAERTFMTPLQRARLTHLLARLPTSNTRLRIGDVARITHFAISHAGGDPEQIVDMLLLNVEKPFSYSLAAKYEKQDVEVPDEQDEEYNPEDPLPTIEDGASAPSGIKRDDQRESDTSNAKLVGLYIISDILSASSTAGARNAWKYRQLFEADFKHQKTFERLGKLDRELGWGRLKSEQWKRKVGALLGIWEGWSVFPSDALAEIKRSFYETPASEQNKIDAEPERPKTQERELEQKWRSRFKPLNSTSASPALTPVHSGQSSNVDRIREEGNGTLTDVDGVPMADIDGKAMHSVDGDPNADVDGIPMVDVDGVPMADVDGVPMTDVDGVPMADVDGVPMADVDGVPMADVDGVPMADVDGVSMADVDGMPMQDTSDLAMADVDGTPTEGMGGVPTASFHATTNDKASASMKSGHGLDRTAHDGFKGKTEAKPDISTSLKESTGKVAAGAPKKRMRAEDMFAESDEE